MNQGAACMAAQWPHSAAKNWVVQLFDAAQHSQGPRCTVSPEMFLKDTDFRSVYFKWKPYSFWSGKRILIRDQRQVKLPAATAGRSSTGSGLLGSVCMSCFVIPSNWPPLHPTLPYQGMARGGNRPWWWMVRFGKSELHNTGAMTNIGAVDNC